MVRAEAPQRFIETESLQESLGIRANRSEYHPFVPGRSPEDFVEFEKQPQSLSFEHAGLPSDPLLTL